MIAFELHTYKDGRWQVDSVFDDREIAVLEAKRVDESRRYGGILVIEEDYDEASNSSTWRTVFRGGRFANRLWGNLYAMQRKSQRAETKARRRKERLPVAHEKPPVTTVSFVKPLLMLLVIVGCGLTALFTLHQIFGNP